MKSSTAEVYLYAELGAQRIGEQTNLVLFCRCKGLTQHELGKTKHTWFWFIFLALMLRLFLARTK